MSCQPPRVVLALIRIVGSNVFLMLFAEFLDCGMDRAEKDDSFITELIVCRDDLREDWFIFVTIGRRAVC